MNVIIITLAYFIKSKVNNIIRGKMENLMHTVLILRFGTSDPTKKSKPIRSLRTVCKLTKLTPKLVQAVCLKHILPSISNDSCR